MEVRFKGGKTFLNCGGSGPDDYLLKPIQGGRWTLVIFRWGRHFRWSTNGRIDDLETAQANANADKEAMGRILPIQQLCITDNARRLDRMKKRGNIPTMSASAFWEKYGGYPTARIKPLGW